MIRFVRTNRRHAWNEQGRVAWARTRLAKLAGFAKLGRGTGQRVTGSDRGRGAEYPAPNRRAHAGSQGATPQVNSSTAHR